MGLKESDFVYATLADIARAHKDIKGAGQWERRREEIREDLAGRAGGDADVPGGADCVRASAAFAAAYLRAGLEASEAPGSRPAPLEPPVEQALSALASSGPPLAGTAAFCRALAVGQIPSSSADLPADLPHALRPLFAQLIDAAREAKHG